MLAKILKKLRARIPNKIGSICCEVYNQEEKSNMGNNLFVLGYVEFCKKTKTKNCNLY